MKAHPALLAAALFSLTACDGEKVKEAKKETAEAAGAVGEAAKEVGGKAMEKSKEVAHSAKEKGKALLGAAKELVGEKGGPALESFKAKMGGFSEWVKKSKGQLTEEETGKAQDVMTEMLAKVKSISPDGLPDDLKSAFQRYVGAMSRVQDVLKTMPAEKEAQEAWLLQNGDRLHALENDIKGATKLLKDAAAKHGMAEMELGD